MTPARSDDAEVVLVCMPFGPVFAPSLGLSLLQAGLSRRGIRSRVRYFSLDFAERVGQHFYSEIATYGRPPHRALAGEWIFAPAAFGSQAPDPEAYVEQVLRRREPGSSDRPVSPARIDKLRRCRQLSPDFVEACARELLSARPRPRIVGFTSVFHQHLASLALARRIKERDPECFVVMGGANCEGEMGAETVKSFPFVDAVVSGEADVVFPELVERVLAGEKSPSLPGVITRKGAEAWLREPPVGSLVQDLDSLPVPDHSDFFEQYSRARFARDWQPSVFFETSRGCWWGERAHCTFCGLNGQTMAYRSKSPERALRELEDIARKHPGCDVQVVDNILDLAYFEDFVPALAARKLGTELFYETKSNLRRKQIELLRQAGITKIQPGIESLSDAVLQLMKKGVTALTNIQLLKWCLELGVEPHWNVLWGFAREPESEYARMARKVPMLRHLPAPRSFGRIRLDRFSPNFFKARELGFVELGPLPVYRHVYALPEQSLRRLAYFFAFDYAEPRDVASYVKPLARELRKWQQDGGRSQLLSIALGDRLVIFDTRPAAIRPLHLLEGGRRAVLEACDAVRARSELAGLGTAEDIEALVRRGLLLQDGQRFLALPLPFDPGRVPHAGVLAVVEALSRVGVRRGRELVVPLAGLDGAPAARPMASSRGRKRAPQRRASPRSRRLSLALDRFRLTPEGEFCFRVTSD